MKLRGTLTEEQMRQELVHANLSLRKSQDRLAAALKTARVNLETAYLLDWIHEQAEDIYAVLISPNEVLTVEVPRLGGEFLLERQSLASYKSKVLEDQAYKDRRRGGLARFRHVEAFSVSPT
jgi:hypothetical protein